MLYIVSCYSVSPLYGFAIHVQVPLNTNWTKDLSSLGCRLALRRK